MSVLSSEEEKELDYDLMHVMAFQKVYPFSLYRIFNLSVRWERRERENHIGYLCESYEKFFSFSVQAGHCEHF